MVENVHMVPGLRTQLIEAGVVVLEREGLTGATLRTIAREAGVSHGAPRRHFATLAALLAAIAGTGFDDLGQRMAPILESGKGFEDKLFALGREYIAFAHERPAMFALMFRHDLLEGSGERLRDTTVPLFETLTGLFAGSGQQARMHALGYWTNLHGIATLVLNRSLNLIRGDDEVDDLIREAFRARVR